MSAKSPLPGLSLVVGCPFPLFFFGTFFLLVAPVKLELFLYWPASRCANGAVFKVVAVSTGVRNPTTVQRPGCYHMCCC